MHWPLLRKGIVPWNEKGTFIAILDEGVPWATLSIILRGLCRCGWVDRSDARADLGFHVTCLTEMCIWLENDGKGIELFIQYLIIVNGRSFISLGSRRVIC